MSKEQRFSNVWTAIEDTLPAAASMQARSSLMMAVQSWAKSMNTQAEAAKLILITQHRMSDLMRGKIKFFSLD
jgi:predicted XRE-type DNA-binding protein